MNLESLEQIVVKLKSIVDAELPTSNTSPGNIYKLLDRHEQKIHNISEEIVGTPQQMGMRTKMVILWRSWHWLISAFTALAAWILRGIVDGAGP